MLGPLPSEPFPDAKSTKIKAATLAAATAAATIIPTFSLLRSDLMRGRFYFHVSLDDAAGLN
jgi:hypothetical protein